MYIYYTLNGMRFEAFTHVMYFYPLCFIMLCTFTHFAPMYNQRMWYQPQHVMYFYPTLYPIYK